MRYGADAVYLAGKSFGMRSAPANFSLEELAQQALPGGSGTLGGNFRPLDYGAVLSLLQLAQG